LRSLAVTPETFREALARWASGVTVVAARRGTQVWGMTASSFSSLSLTPPLILLAIDRQARLLEYLELGKPFVVNLLPEGSQELSEHFAGRHPLPLSPFPAEGPPVLEGALAVLHCQVWARYPGGDHQIVVGEVEQIELGRLERPLIYWLRGYRALRE